MTLYDSSVLIDYLAGEETATAYIEERVDERAIAPPLVLFEIYQGEIFKSGPANFEAVNGALEWVTVVDATTETARAAGELQAELRRQGEPLAARDAFIAGAAISNDEPLAVSDSDFDSSGLPDLLDVDLL